MMKVIVIVMMKMKKVVKMKMKKVVKMMLNMKVEEMVLKIVYISVLMRLVSRTPGHVKLD